MHFVLFAVALASFGVYTQAIHKRLIARARWK